MTSDVTPYPLIPGMRVDRDGRGTFAIAAPRARRVQLCILKAGGEEKIDLVPALRGLWWTRVEGISPGTRYGVRAHGAWDPEAHLLFNEDTLLLDPYAGGVWHDDEENVSLSKAPRAYHATPAMFAHEVHSDLTPVLPRVPSSPRSPALCSVYVPDPEPLSPLPGFSPHSAVIYETHVRGFSTLNPGVPADLRGTYAGLAHPTSLESLERLGVTAVELLPIHAALSEPHLSRAGLSNYWGYNSLSFFAPHAPYATLAARTAGPAAVLDEVREMVRSLHEAGIAVILDVVYNHTAEGDANGPSLSLRGLDSLEYFRTHEGGLIDDTGCGHALRAESEHVIHLVTSSLRWWATFMGIDGFRFDLATTLARTQDGFTPSHPLIQAIVQDPVLSSRMLIAEPWDVGQGGWRTGQFPPAFSEWNDSYRDDVRDFWLTGLRERAAGTRHSRRSQLATRIAGSEELFSPEPARLPGDRSLRGPLSSVTFISAHDGFTLSDLTAYNEKHNEKNGEDNRDGTDANRSFNHGAEGPAPELEADRDRTARALTATLLLSAGIPMLSGGDELLRTQGGNNNAYCQDAPLAWQPWDLTPRTRQHLEFVREAIACRTRLGLWSPDRFYRADPEGGGIPRLTWHREDGERLGDDQWSTGARDLLVAVFAHREVAALVAFNPELDDIEITPAPAPYSPWRLSLDSSLGEAALTGTILRVPSRSVVVLESASLPSA